MREASNKKREQRERQGREGRAGAGAGSSKEYSSRLAAAVDQWWWWIRFTDSGEKGWSALRVAGISRL